VIVDPDAAHGAVAHPRELLNRTVSRHDKALAWIASHVLASRLMADAALVLPLLVLPMSTGAKVTLGVLSGSWIQWWALPMLQRSQNEADAKREAKADADHAALTHIATVVDAIREGKG
jgi:hypothetical protein